MAFLWERWVRRDRCLKRRLKCGFCFCFLKKLYFSIKTHPCIMGVWALKLAPGAWYCAVMCYSRRCSCGQTSAVMGLNLGAILHARAEMVRGYLASGRRAVGFHWPGGGKPCREGGAGSGAKGVEGETRSPPSVRGLASQKREPSLNTWRRCRSASRAAWLSARASAPGSPRRGSGRDGSEPRPVRR